MMHALVGEGEGEADAAGADAADARVAGAGVGVAGVAVADAARAVCAPAATGDEDNCSRGRDRCHAGHEHDGRHHASGRGASAERGRGGRNGSTGPDGSGGSARARAAKYNMATLEERTRFKPRCEVLMVEIKVRNHKGKQGAYTADDHVRHSFLKRTALPGLRWGKVPVPGEHQRTLPDARRRVRSLSLLSLPRALCARSDQTVETVDRTKSWPSSP